MFFENTMFSILTTRKFKIIFNCQMYFLLTNRKLFSKTVIKQPLNLFNLLRKLRPKFLKNLQESPLKTHHKIPPND